MSVLRCAGSFRVSFHDRFTEPSDGSTASHWLNWSLATPAASSFTRSGGLQVAPLLVDRDTKISVPLEGVWSIHEQYTVPVLGPVPVSAAQAGETRARRAAMAGVAPPHAPSVGAVLCVRPQLVAA